MLLIKLFILKRIVTCLFILSSLLAQSNWNVSPMTITKNVDTGDTLTQYLNVYNKADHDQTFLVYWNDWQYDSLGSMPEFDPGILERGCAQWLSITPQTFTIPPNSTQTIRYTLMVPAFALSGSHWGAMFLQTVEKPTLASKMESETGRSFSVFIQMRAKVSLHLTVKGDLIEDGEITGITIEPPIGDKPLIIYTKFLNTGNMMLKCKGSIEVRDEMGEPLETLTMQGFTCFPDGLRIIKSGKNINLGSGEYSTMIVIDFGGDYLVAGEAFFEIP